VVLEVRGGGEVPVAIHVDVGLILPSDHSFNQSRLKIRHPPGPLLTPLPPN